MSTEVIHDAAGACEPDYHRAMPSGDRCRCGLLPRPPFMLLGDLLDGIGDRREVEGVLSAAFGIDPESPDIDACRVFPPS